MDCGVYLPGDDRMSRSELSDTHAMKEKLGQPCDWWIAQSISNFNPSYSTAHSRNQNKTCGLHLKRFRDFE